MIPKDKKIAILHPYTDKKWWAVNMMIFLWNLLQERQNKVKFYTFSYNRDLFSNEIKLKVCVFNFLKIAYAIRKCDYIIIWNSPMQFVWVLSKLLFLSKAKIIWWHHHYPWYYWKNTNIFIFLKRFLEKRALKFIDVLVANSIFIRDALKKIYGLDSIVLYPVLDKEFLNYKYKNKSFNKKTIISYGRWVKWKNLKQIIQTYTLLKKRVPKLELLIWWVWEELEIYKNKYSFDNNIKFLWMLDKKAIVDNLEKSNVFLFPSKIDSFGLSAVEAMSVWIPVVWFSWNWLTEVVQNHKNWYLVESSFDFTEKVFEILDNKDLNINLSLNSLEIRKQLSLDNFLANLDKVF